MYRPQAMITITSNYLVMHNICRKDVNLLKQKGNKMYSLVALFETKWSRGHAHVPVHSNNKWLHHNKFIYT